LANKKKLASSRVPELGAGTRFMHKNLMTIIISKSITTTSQSQQQTNHAQINFLTYTYLEKKAQRCAADRRLLAELPPPAWTHRSCRHPPRPSRAAAAAGASRPRLSPEPARSGPRLSPEPARSGPRLPSEPARAWPLLLRRPRPPRADPLRRFAPRIGRHAAQGAGLGDAPAARGGRRGAARWEAAIGPWRRW